MDAKLKCFVENAESIFFPTFGRISDFNDFSHFVAFAFEPNCMRFFSYFSFTLLFIFLTRFSSSQSSMDFFVALWFARINFSLFFFFVFVWIEQRLETWNGQCSVSSHAFIQLSSHRRVESSKVYRSQNRKKKIIKERFNSSKFVNRFC